MKLENLRIIVDEREKKSGIPDLLKSIGLNIEMKNTPNFFNSNGGKRAFPVDLSKILFFQFQDVVFVDVFIDWTSFTHFNSLF